MSENPWCYRLVGTMPIDFSSLPNLENVDLSYNRLVGTIPETVSLTLASLRLTSNSLNGSILGINSDELRNMIHLDLENNNLTWKTILDLQQLEDIRFSWKQILM